MGGSWGGPECRSRIDIQTHFIESFAWTLLSTFPYVFGDMTKQIYNLHQKIDSNIKVRTPHLYVRAVDVTLAAIQFSLYGATIYYKWNISSLINLVQPCHVLLLLEGIALCLYSATGVLISLFILPVLSGTLLAILCPDTSGLDQFLERELYWVQHYMLVAVPLYLLTRHDFVALRHASFFTVFCGINFLSFAHFVFYEV